jgi:glycerol-3-phosphate dehydrogenase (NAD(P)+)
MNKLAILGAGSWGLTLAWLACDGRKEVVLWDRKPQKIEEIKANRQITFPVEVTLPDSLKLTDSLEEAADDADAILLVVTTSGTREVAQALREKANIDPKTIVVNASKGIEYPSLKRMSDVLIEELPDNPFAVLSGPTLAKEILSGLPTACSIASAERDISEYLQVHLSREGLFRLYSNTDVIGVELGGALKNIFAIASGYMSAKNLGDNARAALLTRGLAEMTRFSVALGADAQTLYGLSGLGDLLATCNSPLSRNFQVGYQLAQGKTMAQVLEDLKVVAEGVKAAQAVNQLSQKLEIDTPIVQLVDNALKGGFSDEMLIKSLMSRKLKTEQAKFSPELTEAEK